MTNANIREVQQEREKAEQAHIDARFYLQRTTAERDFTLDVDMQLPATGISAIWGESGSGKTTLLRCIAGLNKASEGYLCVSGKVWQNQNIFLATHKRPLGFVFQQDSLFPHLSVQGNLDYARKRAPRLTKHQLLAAPADEQQVIELMGLSPLLHQYPSQLSGGERQRVAIARALLIQPSLLLMDEPLSSLDNKRKQEILPYLEALHEHAQIPIIYVSHDLNEVLRLADHVVVMAQGKVIEQGSPQQVFNQVGSACDQAAISPNVLDATLVEKDQKWHLMRLALDNAQTLDHQAVQSQSLVNQSAENKVGRNEVNSLWLMNADKAIGTRLRIQIQPGDIALSLQQQIDASVLNQLPVRVEQVTQLKAQLGMSLLCLSIGEHRLKAKISNLSLHRLNIQVGDNVWALIKAASIIS